MTSLLQPWRNRLLRSLKLQLPTSGLAWWSRRCGRRRCRWRMPCRERGPAISFYPYVRLHFPRAKIVKGRRDKHLRLTNSQQLASRIQHNWTRARTCRVRSDTRIGRVNSRMGVGLRSARVSNSGPGRRGLSLSPPHKIPLSLR